VERLSAETFSVADLEELTDTLTYFWWLCAEVRCGPAFPVGFDVHERPVWSRWHHTVIEHFSDAATWLDKVHLGEAEALFPTFIDRMATPYWRLVLTHAIPNLIDATRPHTVERAITMEQVLLEAVSYSWLVEERKLRTHEQYEKRKAVQNIREMLVDMQVPVAIPAKLTALATTRNPKGQPVDGPQAFVYKRNEIVHRRCAAPISNYDPIIEAWLLGAWYCEWAVLRICGFDGQYRNRLSDNVWVGTVEDVPWC
jgi:hypothetical protein